MRRKCLRPIKVFVTTLGGYQTYLVENNDVFEAALPFVRRFHELGYTDKTTSIMQNTIGYLLVNKDTSDSVMISSCRLYWPNT
jgi:hypothetical protein